jgi:hypothetical protein
MAQYTAISGAFAVAGARERGGGFSLLMGRAARQPGAFVASNFGQGRTRRPASQNPRLLNVDGRRLGLERLPDVRQVAAGEGCQG